VSDLTMTFDVPDTINATLVDPLDVAGDILDVYNEWARANGKPEMGMASLEAEWER
jgi:hypothetical protein